MSAEAFAGSRIIKRDGWDLIFNAGSNQILSQVRKTGVKIVTILDVEHRVMESYTEELTVPAYEEYKLHAVDFYYGAMLTLHQYHMDDGRVLTEFVQEDSMGGENLIYLALRDESTGEPVTETRWPGGISRLNEDRVDPPIRPRGLRP